MSGASITVKSPQDYRKLLEAGRALPSSPGSHCLNRGTVQFVIPPRDAINTIYIISCGPRAIRIRFGTRNNTEELMTPGKVFQVCWVEIHTCLMYDTD